jgi:5-methylthioadenosine/S-adenosylhomocysteine deaminase
VWLTGAEHKLLRESGTVVCHCPSSNLKLASGIAKIPELVEEGVHVCLGADGAPCNNNLDMFTEMRLAALIHKPRQGPLSMSAETVLEMATLGGARALGLEKEIGSIEVGKQADLAVVDLHQLHAVPHDDVVSQLVYSGRASDVREVLIAGKQVLSNGELLTLDRDEVLGRARREADRIARQVA